MHIRVSYIILGILICSVMLACSAIAQNPNSCSTFGYTGYSYTITNDGVNTTLHFTFCNLSPINGTYVNIGEIYFSGLPAPISTTAPSGWTFEQIGPKLFFATTSNPWWKTPPAIKPGDCLSGFSYTIPGLVVPTFTVFMHVQNVTDATGTQAGALGSWFDCSVVITPPQPNPCISITKVPSPVQAHTGDLITYTYKVCNCGNTSLTVTSVSDTLLGNLLPNFLAANNNSATLAVDQCVQFTAQRTVQAEDPNQIDNCVTVTANPPTGPAVDATACAAVQHIGTNPFPCINIIKSVYPTQVIVGQHVTYTYNVCNCGNVALNVTSITDTVFGDLLNDFLNANGGSNVIGVGSCVEFNFVYQVPDTAPSFIYNCVMVETSQGPESSYCTRLDVGRNQPLIECFIPVTFTQEGWHTFANPYNSILPGSIVYNKLPLVFTDFTFYGKLYHNKVIAGYPGCILIFDCNCIGMDRLCEFLPQSGPDECYQLTISCVNPFILFNKRGEEKANTLAGEIIALTLNIAYNDKRFMPRTPGYNLEDFIITRGACKGKKVREVLDMANKILYGMSPFCSGLRGDCTQIYNTLLDVLHNINANYEFIDYTNVIDRGYLKPNVPLGHPGPAHAPVIP